jgi:hypothetical protein
MTFVTAGSLFRARSKKKMITRRWAGAELAMSPRHRPRFEASPEMVREWLLRTRESTKE